MLGLIDGDILHYYCYFTSKDIKSFKKNFKSYRRRWTAGAFCTEDILCINGPTNFRNGIYSEYKKRPGRVKLREERTEVFFDAQKWIKSLKGTVVSENCETDDVLSILHTEDPLNRVVISRDKDYLQLAGMHYNPYTELWRKIDIDAASTFFFRQVLEGDVADNIPGLAGIGVVKSAQILKNKNTFDEKLDAVIKKYKIIHGKEWEKMFMLNATLLWLQREKDEVFSIERMRHYYLQGT